MRLFACTCVIISLHVNVLVQFWVLAINYWQQCVRVPLMYQGNVPAIKLALGVAILTHRTSFLANNVSTTIARYSVERPVNLLSASWFVSELSCQWVDVSASCLVSEMSVKRHCELFIAKWFNLTLVVTPSRIIDSISLQTMLVRLTGL